MTQEEIALLRIGQRVECRIGTAPAGSRWVFCKVARLYVRTVLVRREGRTKANRPYNPMEKYPNQVRLPINLDPQPANVYADWLEEHNEWSAAQKLRIAFPLDNGKEVS